MNTKTVSNLSRRRLKFQEGTKGSFKVQYVSKISTKMAQFQLYFTTKPQNLQN